MLWRDGKALRRSPAYPVKAVDTLGAGDVFHGGFALALAEGRDLGVAMRFASAAAATQVHAAWRLGRRPDAGRGRGLPGRA